MVDKGNLIKEIDGTNTKKKRTIQDYEFVTEGKSNTSDLGKGSYGSVKLAMDKIENKLYAIKIVSICSFIPLEC